MSRARPDASLDAIVEAVSRHEPRLVDSDGWAAATALVLGTGPTGDPSALFIERVSRRGDRWSGQMALPGGKREPEDRDLAHTAVRETAEEVGIELPPAVGRLDDLVSPRGGGHVATFVHVVDGLPATTPEPAEVASTVWIDVPHLFERSNSVRHFHGAFGPFHGIRHGEYTVWGLTLGTLQNFAAVLGQELPRPRGPLIG